MNWTDRQIEFIFHENFHRSPERMEKVGHGSMNFTYDVKLGNEAFILKIYPASRFAIADKQFQLLKSIETELTKVPKALFTGALNKTSYLIYEKIPGETLVFERHEPLDKFLISQQIAHNIKALSGISFRRAGCLTEDEDSFSDWRSFLAFQIQNGFKYLRSYNLLAAADLEKVETFMWKISYELNPLVASLVWSDFSQDNIIIYDNGLSGFIDFESCFAGDPLLSLGFLFAREGDSDFYRAMEEAFMHIFTVKKSHVYFYAILRLLRISRYLSEPLPNGQERGPIGDHFRGLKIALELVTI